MIPHFIFSPNSLTKPPPHAILPSIRKLSDKVSDKYPFHPRQARQGKRKSGKNEQRRNDNNENDYLSLSLQLRRSERKGTKKLLPVHWIIIWAPSFDLFYSLNVLRNDKFHWHQWKDIIMFLLKKIKSIKLHIASKILKITNFQLLRNSEDKTKMIWRHNWNFEFREGIQLSFT